MKTLLIFAKYPEPGKVKTRLGRGIGNDLAAEFYELFIQATLQFASASAYDRYILYFEPAVRLPYFNKLAPVEFELRSQPDGDLGFKLRYGFDLSFRTGSKSVVAIGTDSPTLPPEYVKGASDKLQSREVVLGPAADGGYYLIGLNQMSESLFDGIEWSSPSVLKDTVARAKEQNLQYALMPEWYDVDDFATLARAAGDDPTGKINQLFKARFAGNE